MTMIHHAEDQAHWESTARVIESPINFSSDSPMLLRLTPEAAQELNQLLELTGDTPAVLIRKALGLYKVTQQAIREGKAVGIAETAESLESQFVGI